MGEDALAHVAGHATAAAGNMARGAMDATVNAGGGWIRNLFMKPASQGGGIRWTTPLLLTGAVALGMVGIPGLFVPGVLPVALLAAGALPVAAVVNSTMDRHGEPAAATPPAANPQANGQNPAPDAAPPSPAVVPPQGLPPRPPTGPAVPGH